MLRKGENIYKRKGGRCEGRYLIGHIGNKAKYVYVYSRHYIEVKEKLKKIKGSEFITIKQDKTGLFRTCSEEWLINVCPLLKESTIVKYENILRLYIYPYFAEVFISDLTNEDICHFSTEMLTNGGRKKTGLSAKTVADIMSVMKNILEFAKIKGFSVNASTDCVMLRQCQPTMRIFNTSEQRIVTEYLRKNLTITGLGILLSLYTGLRIGELSALKWGDIDLKNKTLSVTKTMQRIADKEGESKTKIIVTPPKSDCSIRTIPIPDCMISLLKEFVCDKDTYFLTGSRDKFTEPRTMENRFKSVLQKCGVAKGNFHALRHTFATRCVELGFDAKSLSEILGHASVNITLNRYIHPSMELKRKNMDKLSDLFSVI